jgi:hypothetical protein
VVGWVRIRRVVPWVLCALSLGLFFLAGWLRWTLPEDALGDGVSWLYVAVEALGFVGIPVVGALIASRLPANPLGWIWCAIGVAYGLSVVARPLVLSVEGPLWVANTLEGWGFVSLVGLFAFVFLLFPDGRLPSPRWRWVARAAGAITVLLLIAALFVPDTGDPTATGGPWPLHGTAGRFVDVAVEAGVYVLFAIVLAGMVSLVLRFRRAGPVERRQLTWFVYATVVNGVILVPEVLGILPTSLFWIVVSAATFTLLPVALGVAVLRYHLYEIDRIVSRTVSYGLLTAALIGLYLLVVALLRPLLEPLTGSSALAVAGSTLAVAAVFNPARRRLQGVVDRRFDRARYDAARAVDAFAARLRDQVDLDEITAGLCDTVAATVAPGRVGVWLRGPSGLRGSER